MKNYPERFAAMFEFQTDILLNAVQGMDRLVPSAARLTPKNWDVERF
jgi:hypothetical protein